MLEGGAWLHHARHANAMAKRLEASIRGLPGIEISFPVQTNGVFAKIPPEAVDAMHLEGWKFYTGVVTPDESRLMCSWDTTEEDVDSFAADLRGIVSK
jgi:threonine aldolase